MMLLRQYEGKNVAVCCNRSENPWTLPHSGTILLGGGIAEYTGETLTLGQNGNRKEALICKYQRLFLYVVLRMFLRFYR